MGIPMRFHPYFLAFAAAVELGIVFTMSQNTRFRRIARSRINAKSPLPDRTDSVRIKKMLDEEHQRKLKEMENRCTKIKQNAQVIESPRSALMGVSLGKLDALADTYLHMLIAHQNYIKYLSQIDRDRIVRKIDSIERDIDGRNDRVSSLKQKNKEILTQRLARIDRARENIEIVEEELNVMSNTVQLLEDQTISISDPQGISQQIDTVLANMNDTEELVKEMDIFINQEIDTGSELNNDSKINNIREEKLT